MKSFSNDIVSTEALDRRLNILTTREDRRHKITMVLIGLALGLSTGAIFLAAYVFTRIG